MRLAADDRDERENNGNRNLFLTKTGINFKIILLPPRGYLSQSRRRSSPMSVYLKYIECPLFSVSLSLTFIQSTTIHTLHTTFLLAAEIWKNKWNSFVKILPHHIHIFFAQSEKFLKFFYESFDHPSNHCSHSLIIHHGTRY